MIRRAGAVVVAALALAGCGNSDEIHAGEASVSGGDADEVIAAAVNAVLGDESFRSRTSGGVPFFDGLGGVFEQSNGDLVEISDSDSLASATIIAGDAAYEWNGFDQSWKETPMESYDPLMGPGISLVLVLATAFDTSDHEGSDDDLGVATGWTEVEGQPAGARRFERVVPPQTFLGGDEWSDDVPVERLEERAVLEAFYDGAELTAVVDIDADGNLARYVVRSEFDGAVEFPECGALNKAVGSLEQVTEFRDVGTEFTITVPAPAELIAEFPRLGEQPDMSRDDSGDLYDDEFANEAGERDLSGCPTI
ncbi:hypothetical protein BH10ACT3_BH10ACT3_15750 [soil metagenome]